MSPNEDNPAPQPPLSGKEYGVEREDPAHAAARARESHRLRQTSRPEDGIVPFHRSPACCCALALAFLAGVAAGWATARHCDWHY